MELVGYIRVSSKSQEDNTSLTSQKTKIQAFCTAFGHELTQVYVDVCSGKSSDRPQYQMMLSSLSSWDGIISTKLDRLTRSTRDLSTLLEDVLLPMDKHLIFLDMGLDTSTPTGRMVLTMMAAVAQMEREVIKQRMDDGKAAAKASGKHTGGGELRFGYTYADGAFSSVPEEQAVIQRIVQLKSAGESLRKIASQLNKDQVPTKTGSGQWDAARISRLLNREANC